MSEFDKHWNEWAIASNCTEDEAKIHFEAGQQSQQAKIDELQARVDGALKILDGMRHNGAYRAIDILKGNKDENWFERI